MPYAAAVTNPVDRRHARSGSSFEDTIGFSRAVRVGNTIAVSGTAPVWPDGSVDPDPAVQARRCWEIMLAALEELGGSVADVIRTRQYVVDPADGDAVGAVHGEIFGDVRPASTMVVVAALLDPRWKVELELDAVLGS
jgi:enamine deaminase RidA (YjgF/YER057c/UK114 family)